MASNEVVTILKSFKSTLFSSCTQPICSIYSQLTEFVKDPNSGFTDSYLKGITKCMLLSLGQYSYRPIRHASQRFCAVLSKQYPDAMAKCFLEASQDFCDKQKTSPSGAAGLEWLSWSCIVAQNITSDEDLKKLVISQALVQHGVSLTPKSSVTNSVHRIWTRLLSKNLPLLEKYLSFLCSSEDPYYCLLLLAEVITVATAVQIPGLTEHQTKAVDLCCRVLFTKKEIPPQYVLDRCVSIMAVCSHSTFESSILPTMQRSMLRNPELAIFSVSAFIRWVSLDLSRYALDITKALTVELRSKVDERRKLAVETVGYLAAHCSDPQAVSAVIQHIFALLKGSEGKVTVASERNDLFLAVGVMSKSAVTGTLSIQSLVSECLQQYLTVLSQESNESTIVLCLGTMGDWLKLPLSSRPKELLDRFKIGIGPKSASTAVRLAYLQLINKGFNTVDSLAEIKDLVPSFKETIQSAFSQPAQVPLTSEAVVASLLLLKLRRADHIAEDEMSGFWKIALNIEKKFFVSERYLQNASESALIDMASLVEKLVLQYPEKIGDALLQEYLTGIVYAATHKSYQVRKCSQACARKIISGLGGQTLALTMVQSIDRLLNQQNWNQYFDPNSEDKGMQLSAKGFVELLHITATPTSIDSRDLTNIAIASLLPAHHRAVAFYDTSAWLSIVHHLKLSPSDFVAKNAERVIAEFLHGAVSGSHASALKTVLQLDVHTIMTAALAKARQVLENGDLKEITQEEFNIYHWPEGQLYDTSVIEKTKENEDIRNMRRENKLYSYKEQLMEIELRKELEAKKVAEGKAEMKLTKKQMDARAAQLIVESNIRCKVAKLDSDVQQIGSLLLIACESDVHGIHTYLPQICSLVTPLMPFTVPAVNLGRVLVAAVKASLQSSQLGSLVGALSLRVLNAACEIPPAWCAESLETQRRRVIEILADGSPYGTAAFACFYPLLSQSLASGKLEESLVLAVLKIIKLHCGLRSETELDGPALLPRCHMMKSLLDLVNKGSKKVSQSASEALSCLCGCANGGDGCTVADDEEIEVLLNALVNGNTVLRTVALQGLVELQDVLPTEESNTDLHNLLIRRIWISRFDADQLNQKLANQLWESLGLEMEPSLSCTFVEDLTCIEECIRASTSEALTVVLSDHHEQVAIVVQTLMAAYIDKLYMSPAVVDNFGRVVQEQSPDQWQARAGIALALKCLAHLLPQTSIEALITFFVPDALHDRNTAVAMRMRDAATALVENHGKANVNTLLPIFEQTLTTVPNTGNYDIVRQGVIILMGNLAKHLDRSDSRVKPIVAKLIASLSTPSQQVQEAVANCLPALVPAIKDEVPELVQRLLVLLLNSDNYGERRGAAYGLAGLVKGSGILALKQLEIMSTLTEAIENKKNPKEREGALFAFEMLSLMLGRLFEPYIVHVLPNLLLCFGDPNPHVRTAADDTARAVMSKLSAHGVKLVLPLLLKALEEDQWRTKCGSVELLGAMAFCAPKQLSACLPQIVPKLCEVMADSHPKVQQAGATALQHIGEVIKNPEIQSIVPVLLAALQDPSNKTTASLQSLLDTQFVHFIDAPSLALVMPVVDRAIEDRSTETRKMACQIIGNMYSLTDQKDLAPYLPSIMPGLKKSLIDPVPEVRGMSARALGAMVRGIGEQGFEDLLPWLMATLTAEGNSVNRSGAAQGLSEVIGALGIEKLRKYIDEIVETACRPDLPPHVKDGYIMMFIYLPLVFGDEFRQFVGPILPTVLKALADESEFVRDTGLRAGQRIISMFADTSIELLLPELENGLFDENWRIRMSSVQLLGDLLYKLSGVSGKMSTETANEDDNFGTETGHQVIIERLGVERRNRVLSGLYMGRSDTALLVRQASLHVWKVIVSNTPKTLRDILPTLFSLLLGCLASSNYDKREVAARTLGDVVKKLGERVLPEILPILEAGLKSVDADQRQGVCVGLSEIMRSTSRDHVQGYADSLIPTVCKALSDVEAPVREAAAKTFEALHSNIGVRALDDILPNLLEKLDDRAQQEYALDGLKQVMSVKSQAVLPYLVPRLTQAPVNTRALSFLASVAGTALDKELHRILYALCTSLADKLSTPQEAQELEYSSAVVLSVSSEAGVRTVIEELLRQFSSPNQKMQAASASILNVFCRETKEEYTGFLSQLFRSTIGLFTSSDEHVLDASWECLNSITKRLDSTASMLQVPTVRTAMRYATSDLKPNDLLPGFCLPKKGITCLLQVFREGLLNGAPELKESSAIGLADAINRTSAEALKPSVVHITGPLIRVLGDRYGSSVRVATLDTITILLAKCGPMLKPFLPQLQTTFVKALNDGARPVRLKAADAMSQLIAIHVRVDPVFTELNNSIKAPNMDDSSLRETFLHAMRLCLAAGADKMSPAIRQDIWRSLIAFMSHEEDCTRTTAAACIGAICKHLPDNELNDILINHLLNVKDSKWEVLHARSAALFIAIKDAPEVILNNDSRRESVINALLTHTSSDKIPISQFGYRCMASLLRYDTSRGLLVDKRITTSLINGMKSESNDIKQLIGQVMELVSRVANQCSTALDDNVAKLWLPALVNGVKEKNSAVRSQSENALIIMLRLQENDDVYKHYLTVLEPGKQESLTDVVVKNLRRLLKQAEPREEDLDVTWLK